MPRKEKAKMIALAVIILLATMVDAQGKVYEDDARWNCRTMGNQVCGVDPVFGTWSITRDGRLYV